MSALEQLDQQAGPAEPALSVVPSPARSRGWPKPVFPILILALLAVGMVGQLLLQNRIQQQGFELAAMQNQIEHLSATQSRLQAALDQKTTPQQLAYAAAQLGMVANPYSTLLHLPTGQVSGVNQPVNGDELPAVSAPPQLPTPAVPVVPDPVHQII